MKQINKILFFTAFFVIGNCWILYAEKQDAGKKMHHVYAKEGSIQYSYDLSGRLVSAQYPDGIKITYV
ncbi:MAG: RHS repeat protein, partial [Lachnospiraceae bacterium]|nr:RHS repeat protein [Lachnospiraceae bacterium]